ncbi:Puromycin-sensitive aminopeptidase [Pseudoloma neurophilia]|uniref:Puromycin-sensitive aminopeptidase n=1 Tax=Pseudoloma neurophilia TaxID=146866 RepID=A0A0R0LV26_9MICR|nr:Puromycin-sensitive aminopeptidase [Pseudoloma neurophilia]
MQEMRVCPYSINNMNDQQVVRFRRLPRISTYIVAWCIGEMQKVSKGIISIYSTSNIQNAQYALELASRTVAFYEEYFGINYQLDKLDICVIPDFTNYAMENWGLICIKETYCLFNEETAFAGQKPDLADTITHELSHQWFGNLISPVWWDDLWLNEGFATWIAIFAAEQLQISERNEILSPQLIRGTDENNLDVILYHNAHLIDWAPWKEFYTVFGYNRGLYADSLRSSKPIRTPIFSGSEAGDAFNPVTYQKSAAIIRMIQQYYGPEPFRERLSTYLKKFAFSNATSKDFFGVFNNDSLNVVQMTDYWLSNPGFPVIKVESDGTLSQYRMTNREVQKEDSNWPLSLNILVLPKKIQLLKCLEMNMLIRKFSHQKLRYIKRMCYFLQDAAISMKN